MRATAAELKVSERSIVRWRRRDDFRVIEQRTREERLADKPSVRGVLEDGLRARLRNGEPDHAIRLRSAQLLLGAPPEQPDAPTVIREVIYGDRLAAS